MEIRYPFPYSVNPLVPEIDVLATAWAEGCGLLKGEKARLAVVSGRLNYFAGYLYPDAGPKQLEKISRFFLLLFLLDDKMAAEPPKRAHLRVKRMLAATFRRRRGTVMGHFRDAFLIAYVGLWQEIDGDLEVEGRRVLAEVLENYWEGQLLECCLRLEMRVADINEYLRWRRISSGCGIALFFLRWLGGWYGSGSVWDCSLDFAEMYASNMICLANDLGSLEKELEAGEANSFPIILMRRYGQTKEQALEKTKALHDRNVANLLRLVNGQEPHISEMEAVYLRSLQHMVAGSNAWSLLETNRYMQHLNGAVSQRKE